MFTDLGIFLGHALRRAAVDLPRLRLCVIIISGFFLGGIAGTYFFHQFGYSALFLPAALTALISLAYYVFIVCPNQRALF